MVSLTSWSHSRLQLLLLRLEEEVSLNPERFPGYQGRRLTYSDVVNLLYERMVSDGT
jgi:hypothetical protein